MRSELPKESEVPLDYNELLDMLGRVEGEPVFITIGWGRSSHRSVYTLGLVGTLGMVPLDRFGFDPAFGDEAHFAIGSGEALPCGEEHTQNVQPRKHHAMVMDRGSPGHP